MKIFIVAGEPSGDMHAALLMRSIKKLVRDVEFIGIGGEKMQDEGLKSIISLEKIAVIGFVEVIKRFRLFLALNRQCKSMLLSENVDCFIPVDYPGFNLKIARFALMKHIPVYYYIAPQVWAWGKSRWKKLLNSLTELLVVFPFEESFFGEKGINTTFVGHPILDNPIFDISKVADNEQTRENNLIAFFPGSREKEVKDNLKFFISAAEIVSTENPNFIYAFAVSPNVNRKIFDILQNQKFHFKLYDDSYQLMLKARFGIAKAGTTTLEAALLNMNMVVAYKPSLTHYWIGKKLVNLNYIALPNILANKMIVPEFIDSSGNPHKLANAIKLFINDKNICDTQKQEFTYIRELLGKAGASDNAAKLIVQRINS